MQTEVIYDRERENQSVKNGFIAWQECYKCLLLSSALAYPK